MRTIHLYSKSSDKTGEDILREQQMKDYQTRGGKKKALRTAFWRQFKAKHAPKLAA